MARFRPFHSKPLQLAARIALQGARRARDLVRDTRGAAALEFAMIGPPFFLLLFSLFEVGTTYLSAGALQTAVNEAAREIRTGQVQAAGLTAQQFRTLLCSKLDSGYMPCDARLKIDVRRYASFSNVQMPNPLDGNGNFNNDFRYEPGNPCDIVMVRAFYQWTTLTPGLGEAMRNMTGGAELLQASAALRNEPFQGASCGT